ncbi:efflux RND transporter periplasmic adaptor subunit [Oceanisphaera sp. DM8]|uniref:Efflux RND transporter periplasmic adaptor subunit n=2 Tax=Oceanisphaera pacifica TaxID=2818389 RepID=A0ABS3NEE0_9GAMM|nr:efflux RND transporter periplasmic adaptor subunit [Oceanisphaera pacifica]
MLTVDPDETRLDLRFPGRVRAVERAELAFNIPGRLIELPVKEGQRVAKGDLVATLDGESYQIVLASAKAEYNKARTDYNRVLKIWKQSQAIAKAEVDQQRTAMEVARARYLSAKKDVDDTRLTAPFAGVITKRRVENFSNVQAKEPIVSLQDLSQLEIVINVPERIVRNRPKQVVGYAVFSGQEEHRLPVSLKSFSSESNSQTQTYEVVLALEPDNEITILPGMSVDIFPTNALSTDTARSIQVPLQAIYANGDGTTGVWVVNPDTDRVSLRALELGEVMGSNVVVKSGLKSGEKIVTAGVSQLREDMLVRPL